MLEHIFQELERIFQRLEHKLWLDVPENFLRLPGILAEAIVLFFPFFFHRVTYSGFLLVCLSDFRKKVLFSLVSSYVFYNIAA